MVLIHFRNMNLLVHKAEEYACLLQFTFIYVISIYSRFLILDYFFFISLSVSFSYADYASVELTSCFYVIVVPVYTNCKLQFIFYQNSLLADVIVINQCSTGLPCEVFLFLCSFLSQLFLMQFFCPLLFFFFFVQPPCHAKF